MIRNDILMRIFVAGKEKVKEVAGGNCTIISYMICNHPMMWLCCSDKKKRWYEKI
jgi:hypothetical protein